MYFYNCCIETVYLLLKQIVKASTLAFLCKRMACFVLPVHANAEILHKMLRSFRERINMASYGSEQLTITPERRDLVTYELLHSIKTLEEGQTKHHVLYWPLSNDPYQMQRCLLEPNQSGTNNVHLIPITTLIKKIHPHKENRFMPCNCADHSRRIRLNWREFIYPQFVELLFKRIQLPSSCPSPSTHQAQCLINEKCQYSMEIDKRASFLTDISNDLFQVPCSEIRLRHKNRHLEVFGKENLEGWRYFPEQHITDTHYKLFFKLNRPRIRATQIMGGGKITLKATASSAEPYVVFASHFYLLPGKDTPHYRIYVMAPDKQHAILAYDENARINGSKLCLDGELCMIVSSSRLTLEFKEGMAGRFLLATDAGCKVSLGSDYRLALWTKDKSCGWPIKYEIDCLSYTGSEKKFYEKIHSRYNALFDNPPFCTLNMESPARGYVLSREEEEVYACTHKGEPISRRLIKTELIGHNQYGSVSRHTNDHSPEVNTLQVFYKKREDSEPTFPTMRIVYEERLVHNKVLKLKGLCRADEERPWCYFFVNREKSYMLFIPLQPPLLTQ